MLCSTPDKVWSAILPKGTDDNPIQMDEVRFAERRKHEYNRDRLLKSDASDAAKDYDVDVRNMRNHGARVNGP